MLFPVKALRVFSRAAIDVFRIRARAFESSRTTSCFLSVRSSLARPNARTDMLADAVTAVHNMLWYPQMRAHLWRPSARSASANRNGADAGIWQRAQRLSSASDLRSSRGRDQRGGSRA